MFDLLVTPTPYAHSTGDNGHCTAYGQYLIVKSDVIAKLRFLFTF